MFLCLSFCSHVHVWQEHQVVGSHCQQACCGAMRGVGRGVIRKAVGGNFVFGSGIQPLQPQRKEIGCEVGQCG